MIFDTVAKSSFAACRRLLAPGGTYVTTLPGAGLFFWSGLQRIVGLFGQPPTRGERRSSLRFVSIAKSPGYFRASGETRDVAIRVWVKARAADRVRPSAFMSEHIRLGGKQHAGGTLRANQQKTSRRP